MCKTVWEKKTSKLTTKCRNAAGQMDQQRKCFQMTYYLPLFVSELFTVLTKEPKSSFNSWLCNDWKNISTDLNQHLCQASYFRYYLVPSPSPSSLLIPHTSILPPIDYIQRDGDGLLFCVALIMPGTDKQPWWKYLHIMQWGGVNMSTISI